MEEVREFDFYLMHGLMFVMNEFIYAKILFSYEITFDTSEVKPLFISYVLYKFRHILPNVSLPTSYKPATPFSTNPTEFYHFELLKTLEANFVGDYLAENKLQRTI